LYPPQVTLSVRRHTVFGDTIAFCAPVSIMPLWSSPVILDLIDRLDVLGEFGSVGALVEVS
jgi:hypothetical protein